MSNGHILTLNAGSSSIKCAVFSDRDEPERILTGQIERIGDPAAQLVIKHANALEEDRQSIQAQTHQSAAKAIGEYLLAHLGANAVTAVGHRVVHGGMHLLEHQRVTPEVMTELRQIQSLDMSHLPREIALIDAFAEIFPRIPQFVCFDTAFHRDMPAVSKLLPIPRELIDAGIRRFGFHGLSYTYLMDRLIALAGINAASGKIILAHLGAGASMAAVHHGKPIDTTMAFTPTAGLIMGTRPGDFDPGLLLHLMRQQDMSADQADDFISHRCGLLGVSQTSGDMRDLLAVRENDSRAAEAIELFCYQAKKHLCGLTASLAGVDTLIFAGGIGEHIPEIRAAICKGLEFLGVAIDVNRNLQGADVISTADSRVVVRVIQTEEEIVIARFVRSALPLR